MIAKAIGPQNTVGAIGIMPSTVEIAGSTIGRDTPPNALSVVRGKLVQKENYQRPVKIKK